MFSKLAFSNVKKSIKDYTVYFITLTFGVCLFYVFNSIDSQKSMMVLTESQYNIIGAMTRVINGVSVFVSVILGFLIIYANKFLIKRRKKELGIYMTLGMEKGNISRILVIETFIISIFSLGVGLVIGIFAAQGLSVVTARLFEVDLTNFHFTFSTTAFVKTIIYFGIIFIIVMAFNVFMVSKYKLIDLLNAHKQNEKLKVRSLSLSVVLFIVSVACLAFAYRCIIHNGMMNINLEFGLAIGFGSLGTLLFFMSLSGFLLKVIQGNKKFYYKGLNIFILRQINSKINTTFVSMALICIMLLLTIGTLSTGIGLSNALTMGLEKATPFDASIYLHSGDATPVNVNFSEILGTKLDDVVKESLEVSFYQPSVTYKELITNINQKEDLSAYMQEFMTSKVTGIKLSDYNKILSMQGKEPITLKNNEYALNCNFSDIKEYYNLSDIKTLSIGGKEYSLYKNDFQDTQMKTYSQESDFGTIILPDDALNGSIVVEELLNVNYKEANETYEKMFNDELLAVLDNSTVYNSITKQEVYTQSVGLKVMVSYIAIYIGFVFLITSAAVLALQQLSESSDNIERYKLLREIGTDEKMINKALFTQVFIYFMMPLALAIVHSVVGISVANRIVKQIGHLDILSNTVYTALIIIIVYGGYFLATFFSCKNMIRAKK